MKNENNSKAKRIKHFRVINRFLAIAPFSQIKHRMPFPKLSLFPCKMFGKATFFQFHLL